MAPAGMAALLSAPTVVRVERAACRRTAEVALVDPAVIPPMGKAGPAARVVPA